MITDSELEELFDLYNVKCKGIHLKDSLPKRAKAGFYIYNLDSKKHPVQQNSLGTHWTCSVGTKDAVFYFDSYGVICPTEIAKFLKQKYGKFYYNNYIIQDLNSDNCGYFCLGMSIFIKDNQQKYRNMLQCCNEYIMLFDDDAKKNDIILRKFLNDSARERNILEKAQKWLSKMDK